MLCLTFDTDHMNDQRMKEFLGTVEIPGTATFFCTQFYDSLHSNKKHEMAPHPTLEAGVDWNDELARMRDLFPEARGWRAHSCVFSHLLAEWLAENNYHYASTNDQFGQRSIQPIKQPWGIWHFPIYYMDNMDFSSSYFWNDAKEPFSKNVITRALEEEGLYVFDFHPIHILLNTPDRDYYFKVRDRFKAGAPLGEIRFDGFGTGSFYNLLCKLMNNQKQTSIALCQVLEQELSGSD